MFYKNFKTVTYCVAGWVNHVTEEQLRKDADFLQKYVKIDKIYLETYRDEFAKKEKIQMVKKVMADYGIEVSGGITTVTPDLNESDKKRQRLFNTFCYCNEPMRNRLKEVSEYTASLFDEFIIDDFFFTQCMCEDCIREKGDKSWEEFRLSKILEVSEKLIIKPAKKVNPKVHIIIKYPNWRESFQETGYNPKDQRKIFDSIYTGTETRHGSQTDQHLPRYLSYSLMRYFESVLPGKNGGGWFDPFDCDRIDTYLEQAYLTAFAKPKEIMMFCWPAIAGNKRATPLGFMYDRLDAILDRVGNPVGVKTYIPFNSQGDDHIEDYLGMAGIPIEPVCYFPGIKDTKNADDVVLVTAAALEDSEIVQKLKLFVKNGGHAVVTSGFMIGALEKYPEIKDLTSVRYTNRVLSADEFQVPGGVVPFLKEYVKSSLVDFPLLEHRNNATWSIMNAGNGEYHESILCYDTFGKGKFSILSLPLMPSKLYKLPSKVLTVMRKELDAAGIWIDGPSGISLFAYDNDVFGLYCYTWDGCSPVEFNIHVKGKVKHLEIIPDGEGPGFFGMRPDKLEPLYTAPLWEQNAAKDEKSFETVFSGRMIPGDFMFFEIIR
ncbi:MAG: hypothetical protein K6E97_09855 [Treponema sp.]|nr:hypothetical protein [Treponema sp.]